MRAHLDFMVIHGEVHGAPPELEQELSRIAVALVLLLGVGNGLLGQVVLQFEGGDGQTVDEDAQVEGKLRFIFAVAELAGHAEDVGAIQFLRLGIAGSRSTIEEIDRHRAMVDALAKNIHHAALGNFALQPGEKLLPLRPFVLQAKLGEELGLCRPQEGQEFGKIDRIVAVVVLGLPRLVLRLTHQRINDERFKALFAGISRHVQPLCSSPRSGRHRLAQGEPAMGPRATTAAQSEPAKRAPSCSPWRSRGRTNRPTTIREPRRGRHRGICSRKADRPHSREHGRMPPLRG